MKIVQYISHLSILPVFIYMLVRWSGAFVRSIVLLKWFVVLCAIGEAHSYLTLLMGWDNLLFFSIFTLAETFILFQIYVELNYRKNKHIAIICLWGILSLYILFCVITEHNQYPYYARFLQCAAITLLYIILMIKWFKNATFIVWQFLLIFPVVVHYLIATLVNYTFGTIDLARFFYIAIDTMNITMNFCFLLTYHIFLNNHGRNHHPAA